MRQPIQPLPYGRGSEKVIEPGASAQRDRAVRVSQRDRAARVSRRDRARVSQRDRARVSQRDRAATVRERSQSGGEFVS